MIVRPCFCQRIHAYACIVGRVRAYIIALMGADADGDDGNDDNDRAGDYARMLTRTRL